MKNNKLAYRIFKTLSKKERKKLQDQYEMEEIDNLGNQTWLDRFGSWKNGHGGSFWNWLWMIHFKKKYNDKKYAIFLCRLGDCGVAYAEKLLK